MKIKSIIALIVGIFTLLAGLTIWQWSGSNIAIQVGGSGNTIEQKLEPHLSSQSKK
jgi:hypothetical protein